jgi:hypothetical protein
MIKDFIPGTKVSLHNEVGIVLNETNDSNLFGLIRWDTDKECDVEDWRGLFGSFVASGGHIIDQTYEFTYIDDNGKRKEPI